MTKGPIRRGQLIAPFGVGAMVVVKSGISLITAGLDHWFESEDASYGETNPDLDEYKVTEWRLQRGLGVDHFYLPPDYRERRKGEEIPNCNLTIPFLRFPQWHICPYCNRMEKLPLTLMGHFKCPDCSWNPIMIQVRFVAMCDYGHIQDFPWREWVHREANPKCNGTLHLESTGDATLAGQVVKCSCGAKRNLAHIVEAEPDGTHTYLSDNLTKSGEVFLCQGKKPWLGTDKSHKCSRPLRGTLRSASNVYFADVKSAIYLPRGDDTEITRLVSLFEEEPFTTFMQLFQDSGKVPKPKDLRKYYSHLLTQYSDEQIIAAVKAIFSGDESEPKGDLSDQAVKDDKYTQFRREEYQILQEPRHLASLYVRKGSGYSKEINTYFQKIMLIDKLRETRVFAGFSRVYPEPEISYEKRNEMLWRSTNENSNWLPAYVVYGEGIFIEFNLDRVRKWERSPSVRDRLSRLIENYNHLNERLGREGRDIDPRFVLIHTFAHLLINQLTFECGYGSASLRERLYSSSSQINPMAGILIYTAAGDTEGTMGGLVRMAKSDYFEPVIKRALEKAQWCSADPVCMEMGDRGGQGPDSCNLAACHNCALVPETACEEFNRLLDRALVVGKPDVRDLGYFTR